MAFLAASLCPATASALRIEAEFIEAGQSIPLIGTAGERPANAVGDGDLATVVRAAADAWESLIDDDHTLKLSFGWYDTTGVSNSAFHAAGESGGIPQRQLTGSLAFNNDENGFEMFLDPTPHTGEEFSLTGRGFGEYGAGPLEDERLFTARSAEARGRNDLYTAALHEIGHALGLTRLAGFTVDRLDGDIDITLPGFEGTEIPVEGTHLIAPSALLSNQPRRLGERRGVTQLDLLAVCQVSRFEGCATGLAPADYAGDVNGDGVTDAADYTLVRDAHDLLAADTVHAAVTTDSAVELWSNSFGRTFTTEASLAGDFNADGQIDAADYTLWRDGLSTTDYRADADANGRLDDADHAVWAAAYGGGDAIAARTAPVPEPSAAVVMAALAVGVAIRGRRA